MHDGGNVVTQTARAEHISTDDGENIDAKRVGNYETSDGIKWHRTGTQFAVQIDDATTANTIYIGKASIGSNTSSAVWQIAKLDTTSGLVKTWANGGASFSNIFDNRTSLTYQ